MIKIQEHEAILLDSASGGRTASCSWHLTLTGRRWRRMEPVTSTQTPLGAPYLSMDGRDAASSHHSDRSCKSIFITKSPRTRTTADCNQSASAPSTPAEQQKMPPAAIVHVHDVPSWSAPARPSAIQRADPYSIIILSSEIFRSCMPFMM